jgi:hypothetical protein
MGALVTPSTPLSREFITPLITIAVQASRVRTLANAHR